jgi:hypothetical protein
VLETAWGRAALALPKEHRDDVSGA